MERLTTFSLNVQNDGHQTVAAVKGEVDISNATELALRLEGAARQTDGGLTVDLSDVKYMDSSGLRSLMAIHNAHPDTRLVVRDGSLVARVIRVAGLSDVFEVLGRA
ncbi:MAG TPA: STAS domain-containing protein [Armatimonadota bacterium]|jgi:anti-anti-sigma factor